MTPGAKNDSNRNIVEKKNSVSFVITKNRTPLKYMYYKLYLYLSDSCLSMSVKKYLRYIVKTMFSLELDSKYKRQKMPSCRRIVIRYIVNETILNFGSEYIELRCKSQKENPHTQFQIEKYLFA